MTHLPFSSVRMLLKRQSPGPMCTQTPERGLLSWSMTEPLQRQWPSGTVGPGVFSLNGVPSAGGVAAVGSTIGLAVIVAVGLSLLIGFAGQISAGHAAFYALGAYCAAVLSLTYHWPTLVALAVAPIFTGAVALVVGVPVLRLRGH